MKEVKAKSSVNSVFSFDLGKGSVGECVRFGTDIKHLRSDLIPAEFAETKSAAAARRQMRTREAHKAREAWLDFCLSEFGMEVLQRRETALDGDKWILKAKGDPRLEREFPPKGDDTCYNSIALRCKLLLGHKLEKWQIYKALNSAIQLRGYDNSLPWKKGDPESEEEDNAMRSFEEEFGGALKLGRYRYPAFFKAWKMGLWNPDSPDDVKVRIDCNAGKASGYTMPRKLVEAECLKLIEKASMQYPALKGKGMFILYGPSESAYASYYPDLRKNFSIKRGSASDWKGCLSQKVPRFDNRIIDKCSLIPRLNVCKIRPLDEARGEKDLLVHEVTLLMKLLNVRVLRLEDNTVSPLAKNELIDAFEAAKKSSFKFGKRDWKSFLKGINCEVLPGHEEIEKPSESGRASFSRPALRLLKELILGDKSAEDFYGRKLSETTNTDPSKGLVKEDLEFLRLIGRSPNNAIFIPNMRNLASLPADEASRRKCIEELIGGQNDPIVRHRLFYFYSRLKFLSSKFGTPDRVVLEFVRDDFLGKKKKAELSRIMAERRAERQKAAKELDEENIGGGGKILLKYMLLKAQKGECVYTGAPLEPANIAQYEIEHIVPRSKGGADSIFNYVLTTSETNKQKGDRTPYEWLRSGGAWQSYVERVNKLYRELGGKRCALLTREDAYELMEKYTALAESAWIAKLSQSIVAMHFGWPMASDSGERKIFVCPGGTTARIRGRYGLNRILANGLGDEKRPDDFSFADYLRMKREEEKKNRDNKKHHALDALVISFAPDFAAADRAKREFDFGVGVGKNPYDFFKSALDRVCPQNVAFEKPALEETIYGMRTVDGKAKMTVRRPVEKFAYKQVNMRDVYDISSANKSVKKVMDKSIASRISAFAETNPSEEEWLSWCANFRCVRKDGSPGPVIRKCVCEVGEPAEYKDLSKDGCGAWRKGKIHKGQLVWRSKNGGYFVKPVYAHSSKFKTESELKCRPDFDSLVGFFRSGCLVEIAKDILKDGVLVWPKGIHKLNTIRTNGQVNLTDCNGVAVKSPLGIKILMEHGFKRYYPDKEHA